MMSRRFTLQTLLIALAVLAFVTTWFREPLRNLFRQNYLEWNLVETKQDFKKMLSNQNAIVFVHANWSSASVIAKREFEEFQIDWKLHNSDARNRFYLIDHSKLTPDWLFEWGKSDGMLGLIHNGYGESIWIKDGKAKLRITGHQIKSDELPGMTEKAFE